MYEHMTKSKYCAVFKIAPLYFFTCEGIPDQHDGPFTTKLEALMAARSYQIEKKRDPNYVLDLTSCDREELEGFGL